MKIAKKKWILLGISLNILLSLGNIYAEPITEEELGTVDKAGTYEVAVNSYDSKGDLYQKIIKVTVTFPNTVIVKENKEGIDATDIRIQKHENIHNFSNQELINRAKAHAWSLETGLEVPITKVTIDTQATTTTVTLATEKGTSINVRTVIDAGVLTREDILYSYSQDWNMRNQYWIQFGILIIVLLILPIILILLIYVLLQRKIRQTNTILYEN